jgi:2-methylfumaryl-CoA hydratase
MESLSPTYGRKLDDFKVGDVYPHPWAVSLSDGFVARCQASFMDACPTYAAGSLFDGIVDGGVAIHPLVLLNLGLSFSVHDVSEQAIAHLAYVSARFPELPLGAQSAGGAVIPAPAIRAYSEVLDVKASSSGDKGVVHVRTVVHQGKRVLAVFERKALIPAGRVEGRPATPTTAPTLKVPKRAYPKAFEKVGKPAFESAFPYFFEDLEPGLVFAHGTGRTIGDSEHMELTTLFRNSHPLHFDEVYCASNSFAKARVVYGGLVLAWAHALSSRDLAGNAIAYTGFEDGAHPNPTLAGDTLYAASKVLAREDLGKRHGSVTVRLVGVKNMTSKHALAQHPGLFDAELGKAPGDRIRDKVVEITHTFLVRKRG